MLNTLRISLANAIAPRQAKKAAEPSIFGGSWLWNMVTLGGARTTLDRFVGINYSCIEAHSNAVAGLTWKIYRRSSSQQDGRDEVGPKDPWVGLKEKPCKALPHFTFFDIIKEIDRWQSLPEGEAVLWGPRTPGKKAPDMILVIPPNLIRPYAENGEFLTGYKLYTPRGLVKIPKEEVCWIPLISPSGDLSTYYMSGRGRTMAAVDEIDVGYFSRRYLKNFYGRNAIPDMVFETEAELYDPDKKPFIASWLERFQGENRSHEPAFLPQKTKAVILDTSGAQKNMLAIANDIAKQVAAVYRVPMGILTGEFDSGAPATSWKGQHYTFYENEIKPVASRIELLLTAWAQNYDPDIIIGHEPISWKDPVEVRADEKHRLETGRATVNDLRRENGEDELPPDEGGVVFFGPALTPLKDYVKPAPPPTPPSNESAATDAEIVEDEEAQLEGKARALLTDPEEATKAAYWRRYDDQRAAYSDLLVREVRKGLRAMERDALAAIDAGKAIRAEDDDLFDEEAMRSLWLDLTEADRLNLVDWTFGEAFRDVDHDFEAEAEEFKTQVKAAADASADLIKEPVKSIHSELKKLVTSYGTDRDAMRKAIVEKFKGYSDSRAKLIADTTAAVTINASQKEAWKGLDIGRKWLSRRDKRVRGAHKIDGQKADDEGYFTLTDGRKVGFPSDPRERCIQMPDVAQTNPQAG